MSCACIMQECGIDAIIIVCVNFGARDQFFDELEFVFCQVCPCPPGLMVCTFDCGEMESSAVLCKLSDAYSATS